MSSNFNTLKSVIAAAVAGALFGAGLAVSEMMNPKRVIGFLDFAGDWDPSLAFVMAFAVAVAFIGYRFGRRRSRPFLDDTFHLPDPKGITPRLIAGAALFGIGWGLAGLCPGPAIASLITADGDFIAFALAMLVGIAVHLVVDRLAS